MAVPTGRGVTLLRLAHSTLFGDEITDERRPSCAVIQRDGGRDGRVAEIRSSPTVYSPNDVGRDRVPRSRQSTLTRNVARVDDVRRLPRQNIIDEPVVASPLVDDDEFCIVPQRPPDIRNNIGEKLRQDERNFAAEAESQQTDPIFNLIGVVDMMAVKGEER